MTDHPTGLSGSQRAAIFLLGVGEESAASIMRHMDPREVQRVGEAMTSLSNVSNEQLEAVVSEFSDQIEHVNALNIGTEDFTRRVMVGALGETKARNMLSKVMRKSNSKGVEALKWMDARPVAALLSKEHPQIAAIVLSSLEAPHAAEVLALISADRRADIIYRLATLELIDAGAMHELDQILEKQLGGLQELPPSSVNGVGVAASILNHLESSLESAIMDSLKERDEVVGEKVRELMFVFEDLLSVNDRGMQRLLRDIAVDRLVVALKGVNKNVQDKFFNNMSSRASEMLREDMESKGPVKLSEVEEAQKEILTIAASLAEEGEIILGGGGGGDTVV
jgi:flagellar motor switch protein FliG